MKKLLFILSMIVLSVTMFQCAKEGPVGPKGPAGLNGQNGNANVITYLITDSAKLVWAGSYIQLYYDSTFTVPDSIRDEGVVLIYMKFLTNPEFWYPCPGHGPNGTFQTRFAIGETRIAINILDADGTVWSGGTPPAVTAVRIVLIPASTVVSVGKNAPMLNFSNHDAVMSYFRLE